MPSQLERELEDLDRQARQRSDEALERLRQEPGGAGKTEDELLAAQNERQRRIRLRNAEAARKRALSDLERAKRILRRRPASRMAPLNQTGRSDALIDAQRNYLDARVRQIEAERELRVLGQPIAKAPAPSPLGSATGGAKVLTDAARRAAGAAGTGGAVGPGLGIRAAERAAGAGTGQTGRRGGQDTGNILAGATSGATSGATTDVRARQQQLKDLGYYRGRIDGIWGPLSRAAEAAWKAAGQPTSRQSAATSSTAAGGGFNPAAAGGYPTPTDAAIANAARLPGANFETEVLANFPQMAPFFRIPEVATLLRSAIAEGWPSERMAAEVKATEWWRTTPQRTRAWLGLQALDPATAERQIEESASRLRELADAYFVPVADVTLKEWGKKLLSGEVPEDGFHSYIKSQAKSMRPALSAAIDRGITVAQFGDPYKQVAAMTLEINPNDINFNDAKWQRPFNTINPKTGEHEAMSIADWQTLIKTDAAYGFDNTFQARQQAAELARKIQETFGKVS